MTVKDDLKQIIDIEARAVMDLTEQVNDSYVQAFHMLEGCKGKVVVTGVGKSGHVGKKIAASLASTGTPAFFVHSTEGLHGDLGMIEQDDVVIMLSNSGETEEVCRLFPTIKKTGAKVLAITSGENSKMARLSDVAIIYKYNSEADHLGLAPTTSSTMTLVIGDALAVALSKAKKFTKEDFHLYHPGGSLGEKLSQ